MDTRGKATNELAQFIPFPLSSFTEKNIVSGSPPKSFMPLVKVLETARKTIKMPKIGFFKRCKHYKK
jgi:hypothetical protein